MSSLEDWKKEEKKISNFQSSLMKTHRDGILPNGNSIHSSLNTNSLVLGSDERATSPCLLLLSMVALSFITPLLKAVSGEERMASH